MARLAGTDRDAIRVIVAIDGPAASGKGTIARAVASAFGLPHLDTGLLYRAVGAAVLASGGDPQVEAEALAACAFEDEGLADPALATEAVGRAASIVSAHPVVRVRLLERQRAFARQPGGAVLDGRDIGTVIAPEAEVKLFVTASAPVRARRRWAQLAKDEPGLAEASVLADIEARDARDLARAAAPLRRAPDALLLDTSEMGIDAAVSRAVRAVVKRTGVQPGPTPSLDPS